MKRTVFLKTRVSDEKDGLLKTRIFYEKDGLLKTRVSDEKGGLLKDRSTSMYGRDRSFDKKDGLFENPGFCLHTTGI